MAMKARLEDVQVLETYQGEFESKEGQTFPFYQLRVYSFGENFPGIKTLKVKKDDFQTAAKLVGERCNLLVDVFTGGNKTKLTFLGRAS